MTSALPGTSAGTAFSDNQGIVIQGEVVATNTATITLNGTGGLGSTVANHGVNIASGIGVSSVDGDISITGNSIAGIFSHGIRIADVAEVSSSGNGNLTLNGTASGGFSHGIAQLTGGRITATGTGAITLTAASDNADDLRAEPGAVSDIGGAGVSANITINANTISWEDFRLQSTGNLIIQPRTAGTTIGLGDGSGGTLNLISTELGFITGRL